MRRGDVEEVNIAAGVAAWKRERKGKQTMTGIPSRRCFGWLGARRILALVVCNDYARLELDFL